MSTILKCKMCGGDIEVSKDMSIGTCLYCGSTMTLPRIDNDKKVRLFNRANLYRLNNEFDKAYDAYKAIAEEDEQEAEAYWGMLLSEYGVEYVEDPVTKKRIPTCHRTLVKSIKTATDFELACKYADVENRLMYQDEADVIEEIQNKILSISRKVEAYDVFICYIESDENRERTLDSVLAQDIYEELERQGIRTFFSRISLREKLGQDYEPNIFAALQSAKVMLMVTTSNEHCNAVWVKNEWSRYIGFMKENHNKVLIPVCKDINPYELPPELTKFQAQDMNKVGAMQDLIFAVKRLVLAETREKKDVAIEELIKEKAERKQKEKELKEKVEKSFIIVKKLVVCLVAAGIIALVGFIGLQLYNDVILPNNQMKQAEKYMEEENYIEALRILNRLEGYKETGELIRECKYQNAVLTYERGDYKTAYDQLSKDLNYSDAKVYWSKCLKDIQLAAIKKSPNRIFDGHFEANYKKMLPEDLYEVAKVYYGNQNYEKAIILLEVITDYDNAVDLYYDCVYQMGVEHYEEENYRNALDAMYKISEMGYVKGSQKLEEYQQEIYARGMDEYNAANWKKAAEWFGLLVNPKYKDSSEKIIKCLENE